MYGNMPLIEPQETKELRKIEDFVIAIDTSMSCKEELITKTSHTPNGTCSLKIQYFS